MKGGSNQAVEKRQLSIAQWRALADDGTVIPMRIPLEGDSMRPLIRRGRDPVTILPLSRKLRRGDVVLFENPPGRYVVHRVYRLKDGAVQTLGDNCWNPDPWMAEKQVLGQAVQAERNGRKIPLDNRAARAFGRLWMACHPMRMQYRKLRSLAGRCYRRIIPRREGDGHGE